MHNIILLQDFCPQETEIARFPIGFRLRPSPVFFVYCRMRFLILGRSVGKRKKKKSWKIV